MSTAVASTGVDAGIAWHFGEPLREQRALAEGAVIIDRSNRGVLAVPGSDRLGWLHSICAQHVANLLDGDTTQTLILSPNGHAEQHWLVTDLGGQLWIDVEPGMAPDALGYLEKMRFLKRVEPADVTSDFAVLTLLGPTSRGVLEAAGLPLPPVTATASVAPTEVSRTAPSDKRNPVPEMLAPSSGAQALPNGGLVRRAPAEHGAPAEHYDVIVPRAAVEVTLDRLVQAGATRAGAWAFDAWRVEHRLARLGVDTDHRTLAHEAGWIGSAVHLDKGCYRGQETVARVQNLGRPPRRLVLLHLSGESDVLPEAGTEVQLDGRAIGFLGTAVHHYELGPIGLAIVKRSVADEAVLSVGNFSAAIDPD